MDERDQPDVQKIAGDLVEDGPEKPSEPWVVTIGHNLGLASRVMSDAAHQVRALFRRAPAPVQRPARVEVAELLKELAEHLSGRTDDGYATLAEDEELWRLVRQLDRQRPRRRWPRRRLSAAAPPEAAAVAPEPDGPAGVADTMALLGLSAEEGPRDGPGEDLTPEELGEGGADKKKSKEEQGEGE